MLARACYRTARVLGAGLRAPPLQLRSLHQLGAVLAETKSTMSVVGGDDVATPLAGAAAALRRKASQKMHTEGLHPTSAQRGTGALGSETRSVEQTPIQELILRDHTVVKLLREKYMAAIDADVKKEQVYTLIFEICRHGSCEELVLYPALRNARFKDGDRLADESLADHTQIMTDLKQLDKTIAIGHPEFERLLAKTVNEFIEHGAKEERTILPLITSVMSNGELLRLGERFQAAEGIVTSRPHPMVPREGLKGTVSHMLSKPLDMMRDQLEGRASAIKEHSPDVQREAATMLKGEKHEAGEVTQQ